MGHAAVFTDDNFEAEVLKSQTPVLVDFYGPHCAPCRQLAPVIEELALEYAGAVKIGKIDVGDHQMRAGEYGVMGVPTLIIFKDGKPVQRMMGAQPKAKIQQAIDAART